MAMHRRITPEPKGYVAPMSIEELESGLRLMNELGPACGAFWDSKVEAFRQTVVLAIRETSNALLSPRISERWRADLTSQLQELGALLEFADRHVAARERLMPWLH
jgi:hypothetical protein